jgi:hypothetical protein
MARSRDYKTEYARRIANAGKRGLSRSQARGHARPGETPIRQTTVRDRDRFEAALKLYRQSGNRAASAKALKLAPERFGRFLSENVQIEGRGRALKITDHRTYEMAVISQGELLSVPIRGFDQKSLNGQHLNAVKAFLSTNDIDVLAPFVGRSIIDARGVSHPLETRPNTLRRLAHAGDEQFPEIYRLTS